ncbi:YCF48-related protein [Candidatus Thiosymbion oneisti]|uniref:YCF48-related protein n=1 Tax=Candidatus Thiosymbion oneisti TaxID=589554 RepID=UPI000B7EF587|nr:YCF48-related protein [Candidatus Thiosymbion oneisti]
MSVDAAQSLLSGTVAKDLPNRIRYLVERLNKRARTLQILSIGFLVLIFGVLGAAVYGVISAPKLVSYDLSQAREARAQYIETKQKEIKALDEDSGSLRKEADSEVEKFRDRLRGRGAAWTVRNVEPRVRFNALTISPNGAEGWLVGRDGTILRWEQDTSRWMPEDWDSPYGTTDLALNDVAHGKGRQGVVAAAVGRLGTVLVRRARGGAWTQTHGADPAFRINFRKSPIWSGGRFWVLADKGLLSSKDPGKRFQRVPTATGALLTDLHFDPEGQRGWIVGSNGTLLITTDGGQIWQQQDTGTDTDLYRIKFSPDGRRGMISGWTIPGKRVLEKSVLLGSNDSGATWQRMDTGSDASLYSVHFGKDGRSAWVVGDKGTLLRTTDGGQTWQPLPTETEALLYQIWFSQDEQRGWIVGAKGTLLRTTDGGQTWQPLPTGTDARLYRIQFSQDEQHGWIIGTKGTLLRTTDGGQTWQPLPTDTDAWLYRIQFSQDEQRGWIIGDKGTLLRTTDGGQIWTTVHDKGVRWNYMAFAQDGLSGIVWRPSDKTIDYTSDGGQSWNPADVSFSLPDAPPSLTDATLFAVDMDAEGRRIWAVGANGTLIVSDDGGGSWALAETGVKQDLTDIRMADNGSSGLVIGEKGVILRTEDGGQNWKELKHGTNVDLKGLHLAADGQTAWVVGEEGRVLHTKDGGDTWESQKSGIKATLTAVHFDEDLKTGWIVGLDGLLVRTLDGGQTWTLVETGTDKHLYAVGLSDDGTTGWIAGDKGTLLQSSVYPEALAELEALTKVDEIVAYLENDAAPEVVGQPRLIRPLKEITQRLSANSQRKKTLNQEIETLRDTKIEEAKAKKGDLYFHLSTNAIRFAILVIAFFLAQILVNSYRYNVRLGGFYNARADALVALANLSRIEAMSKDMDLSQFADVFSPTSVDFGHPPKIVTEQALEIVKEILRTGQKKIGSG